MPDSKKYNYQLENSVADLFKRLPRQTIHDLSRRIRRLAPSYGLTYINEKGKTSVITLTLRPRLLDRKKRAFLWNILHILDTCFEKIGRLYFQIPSIAEILPFSNREREWIKMMRDPQYCPGRIASRWDANTTFGAKDWEKGFSFFEVNGVGVGGIWYSRASAELTLKTIVPELRKMDPHFHPVPNDDMARLLLGILLNQRNRIGRRKGFIALAMEKASGSNYVEFERLAKFYTSLGYKSLVTEPTDFKIKGDEIVAKGKIIDILYRDTTLSELCGLEEKGHHLDALRLAFRRGQAVSSLEGEFDHKSVFEIFTDPKYEGAFSARQWRVLKRYILWTRLIRQTKTTDFNGRTVDLIPFSLKNQAQLVLKPNRLYGGKGIVFGREVNKSEWHKIIENALLEPGEWTVQKIGELRTKRFYRPEENGASEKELYVVSGFFPSDKGIGIVGRMSERTVVNVARRGGLTPILLLK